MESPEKIKYFGGQDLKIIHAACGGKHSLFVTSEGNVLSCGYVKYFGLNDVIEVGYSNGLSGQLGHLNEQENRVPQPVGALTNLNISRVAAGEIHSLALSSTLCIYVYMLSNSLRQKMALFIIGARVQPLAVKIIF